MRRNFDGAPFAWCADSCGCGSANFGVQRCCGAECVASASSDTLGCCGADAGVLIDRLEHVVRTSDERLVTVTDRRTCTPL